MNALVWQWGRHGAGPRYAVELANALRNLPEVQVSLSLSREAEIARGPEPPRCELPFRTYSGHVSFGLRLPLLPLEVRPLADRVAGLGPGFAICAMPAVLDLVMTAALRRARVPFAVIVHDADPHPGDEALLRMAVQRRLIRRAAVVVALSDHVARRLRDRGGLDGRKLILARHPPFAFGPTPRPPRAHAGARLRLLSFGRLLRYKGLDILADALRLLGPRSDLEVRVIGRGPETPILDVLRLLPNVTVENRWVPERELGEVFAWADALILSHREASQSGVAAAAIAARRWVVATRVGGLPDQLAAEPMARLCEPTPESLAQALRALVETRGSPQSDALGDVRGQWMEAGSCLVRDIGRAIGASR